MIKVILIVASLVLLGLIISYSWLNRDSDRVVLTLVTAVTLGALGFITKESISNKTEKYSKSLPIVVLYGQDYRLLNIKFPYSFDLNYYISRINKSDIEDKKDKNHVDIKYGTKIYKDALEHVVLHKIFSNFQYGWEVESKLINTPSGTELRLLTKNNSGENVDLQNIQSLLKKNYFTESEIYKEIELGHIDNLKVPGDLDLKISKENHILEIDLETKYIDVRIKFMETSSSIGMGIYSEMFNKKNTHDAMIGYGTSNFLIFVEVEQNWWLNGHPAMKIYRNWADTIVNSLDTTFNYNYIQEEHYKQYQLFGVDGILNHKY